MQQILKRQNMRWKTSSVGELVTVTEKIYGPQAEYDGSA